MESALQKTRFQLQKQRFSIKGTRLMETFDERLRSSMEKVGIKTFRDLSIRAGINPNTITTWIKRGEIPSGSARMNIANILKVDYEWLRTGKGQRERGARAPLSEISPEEFGEEERRVKTQLEQVLRSFANDILAFDYNAPGVGYMGLASAVHYMKKAMDELRSPTDEVDEEE